MPILMVMATVEIHVHGHLYDRLAAQFEPLTVTDLPDGCAVLQGVLADQAALYGVLARMRDFGLLLLALRWSPEPMTDEKGGLNDDTTTAT
jgi:hypothetical protein